MDKQYLSSDQWNKTLLGRTTEEDSLLNFARDNDFKYLILYDLNKIFAHPNDSLPGASIGGSNRTYKQALCDFIVKAKTQFCIEHIGAAVASTSILSDITDFNSLMITDPIFLIADQIHLTHPLQTLYHLFRTLIQLLMAPWLCVLKWLRLH